MKEQSVLKRRFSLGLMILMIVMFLSCTEISGIEDSDVATDGSVHVDTMDYCMRASNVTLKLSQMKNVNESELRKLIIESANIRIRIRSDWSVWNGEFGLIDMSQVRMEASQDGYEVVFVLIGTDDEIDQFTIRVYVEDDIKEEDEIQPQPDSSKQNTPTKSKTQKKEILKKEEAPAIESPSNDDEEYINSEGDEEKQSKPNPTEVQARQQYDEISWIAVIFFILTGITLVVGGIILYSDLKLLRWCGWRWRR